MPASLYLRGKLVDAILRGQAFTPPANVYVSLHTSDPTANANPSTEVSAPWYQRKLMTFAAQSTAGQSSNSNTVTFDGVTGTAVTVTHFALWDAQSLGNMLFYGSLSSNKTFAVTDVPTYLPGVIAASLT